MKANVKKTVKKKSWTLGDLVAAAREAGVEVDVKLKPSTFDIFYMIFAQGGESPKVRHDTFAIAQSEAKRIYLKEGREVFMMMAVAKYSPAEPEFTLSGKPSVTLDPII